MTDFLFSYQHKAREIESISLLKVELERRGYSVDVCCTFDENRIGYAKKGRPKVAVTSAMYDDNTLFFFVYDICGFNKKVVNLQWEQVLSIECEEDLNAYHNPKQNAKNALHLCWGEEPRKRLMKSGVLEKNLATVGPIHMDFLRKEFRSFYYNKQELSKMYSLDDSKKWCLYISSFTLPNMTEEEFNTIFKSFGDEVVVMRNVSIESKRQTLLWFEEALSKNPDVEFIYRAHPDENMDRALDALKQKYKNFHLINEKSVKQWIIACDKIYTWYSTSLIEVFFSGKTCGILRPVVIPEKYEIRIYQDGHYIKTKEAFLASLNKMDDNFPVKEEDIRAYYAVDKDVPSYLRICDLLETVHKTSIYDMKIPLKLRLRHLLHLCYGKMLEIFSRYDYRKIFFFSPSIIGRLSLYNEVMHRVRKDRDKNHASEAEMKVLSDKLSKIVKQVSNAR